MDGRELTRQDILDELRELKPELQIQFGVTRLGLFGSFARGGADSESDIDVVVELAEPDLFALVHIKEKLEEDFSRQVDLVALGPFMNAFLRSRIQSEAVYV